MFKKVVLLVLPLMASTMLVQSASAREFAGIYTECGLGAIIAPNTPVVAVITNITFDLGTTAISSNISSPETCKGGKETMASFINDAYEYLETDLAAGSGTYLDLLFVLVENDTLTNEEFVASLRNDFAAYVANPDFSNQSRFEKAEALYNMVYDS